MVRKNYSHKCRGKITNKDSYACRYKVKKINKNKLSYKCNLVDSYHKILWDF
jgi:hypothetical protein